MARYPVELEERWETSSEPFLIRPVRPEDVAEYKAFFIVFHLKT